MTRHKAGILFIAIIFAVCGVVMWLTDNPPKAESIKQEAVFGIEDMVKDLQKAVGAVPDGVIGYETMQKVNEAVKAKRRGTFNKYAAKSMRTKEMTFEDMNKAMEKVIGGK